MPRLVLILASVALVLSGCTRPTMDRVSERLDEANCYVADAIFGLNRCPPPEPPPPPGEPVYCYGNIGGVNCYSEPLRESDAGPRPVPVPAGGPAPSATTAAPPNGQPAPPPITILD